MPTQTSGRGSQHCWEIILLNTVSLNLTALNVAFTLNLYLFIQHMLLSKVMYTYQSSDQLTGIEMEVLK